MKGLSKLFLLLLIFIISISYANSIGIGSCLEAEVTDISPTSIELGEEFTVGILIDNCGYTVPNYVVFEIKEVSPYIEVIEPLKIEIPKMGYATSERFLVYHMRVKENAVPGTYLFKHKLTYGPRLNSTVTREGEFSINLIGKKANLNIASLKTNPTLPKEDDTVELTLRIENYGEGEANSVKVRLNHGFKGIKEAYIGTLQSNEDSPVVYTFIPSKNGEYTIPVTITYVDDFGRKDVVTEISLTIFKKETNIFAIIFFIILIGGVLSGVYYLLKKYDQKDKIIKELLGGEQIKKGRSKRKQKR